MELKPLQREYYELILPWFEDAETQRRLGGFYPIADQLKLIEKSPNKFAWLVWQAEVPVGLIELEVEGDTAHPLILIAPAARGRGFGHELVTQLVTLASQLGVREVSAGVSVNNLTSCKCFERASFQITGEEDGFNTYVLLLPDSSLKAEE